ncbi:hydroxyisourate hydrolase [Aquitalea sp. LB_tupeE]|uniref:hydroxyisourate hydrolase n=1 Tax=Aquitalea sp. LB_tupeE TaxID=2748078 RepID=UPI0015BB2AB3|nr:hydroxyisourate hydrolase [Aquitalea sp. LB_tupeE]NWK78559.1 hydroxyisourate hydrolase [Aquitalea sp. LB_tupeE]
MGQISTHVLDTMHGCAAKGMYFELYRVTEETRHLLCQQHTNADGRSSKALLKGDEMKAGIYELIFHAGDYFIAQGVKLAQPSFIDQVILRFGIADTNQNYHVPLIITPWTYSTYRGS